MARDLRGIAIAGALFPAAAAATTCVQPETAATADTVVDTVTAAEREEGWRPLFDGRTTEGWRGYGREDVPDGWRVVDGALVRVTPGAGDIVTKEKFRNFELRLDWRVGPGGNSGVFYRGSETADPIWHTAPEMQVLDDERHPDSRSGLTSAGALYGLYPARRGVVRSAGEWNEARILLDREHGEHWLNGVKLFEFEIGGPDWNARIQASKFARMPGFGRAAEGHIGLQDHSPAAGYSGPRERAEFRNIRIRLLP